MLHKAESLFTLIQQIYYLILARKVESIPIFNINSQESYEGKSVKFKDFSRTSYSFQRQWVYVNADQHIKILLLKHYTEIMKKLV